MPLAGELLWLRSRRWPTLLVVTSAAALALALMGTSDVPMPSLLAGSILPVPLGLLVSLVPALAIINSLTSTPAAAEMVSTRAVWIRDLALAVVTASVAPTVLAVTSISQLGTSGRNSVGLVGLAMLGLAAGGRNAGIALPLGFLALTLFIGRSSGMQVEPWAWPMMEGSNVPALAAALCLFTVGCFAFAGARGNSRRDGQLGTDPAG